MSKKSQDTSLSLSRIVLGLGAISALAAAILMAGLATQQWLAPVTEMQKVVTVSSPPLAMTSEDFLQRFFHRADRSEPSSRSEIEAEAAAEQLFSCLQKNAFELSVKRGVPGEILAPSRSVIRHYLSLAMGGVSDKAAFLSSAPAFICVVLTRDDFVGQIASDGLELYAVDALSYLSEQWRQRQQRQLQLDQWQATWSELDSRLILTVQRMIMSPVALLSAAVVFLGVFLLLVLLLRMTWLSRKIQLIDRSIRYGSLSGSHQKDRSTRQLPGQEELNERGLYVAAADVNTEANPKIITLTVANAGKLAQSAMAHFVFFDDHEQRVGSHRSPEFVVPPEGIFSLKTEVPPNDGSWVKWRSEIVPA